LRHLLIEETAAQLTDLKGSVIGPGGEFRAERVIGGVLERTGITQNVSVRFPPI
jgi:hypothetical protein